VAYRLTLLVSVKQCVESSYMAFEAFAEPTRPCRYMKYFLSLDRNIAQSMIRGKKVVLTALLFALEVYMVLQQNCV
jgi:hypothetical protein